MEKIKKIGDGICCPVGAICPEEGEEPEEYVNPFAVPYVQSEHLRELIAKKTRQEQKVKVVQKKT
jgi:hypothetical protein